MDTRTTVMFTDMSKVTPPGGTRPDVTPHTWQAVSYRSDDFSGTMLFAHGTTAVPELTLHVKLEGLYRIYIGMLHTVGVEGAASLTGFRLTKDRYPHVYEYTFHGDFARAPYIMEAEWKTADMTGQEVHISHPEGGIPCLSTVAYMKFVPVEEQEVPERRLLAFHDMHGALCYKNPRCADDIVAELAPLADSDVSHLMLEYYMDVHDPAFNERFFWSMDGCGCYAGHTDAFFYRSRDAFIARGEDPYAAVASYAREIGLKVGFSFRMNYFANQPPWDIGFNSRLYTEHPEWRCIDRDGSEIARLSYAYPEMANLVIDLFCRMIRSGCDGVHLLFNRGIPNLLYEKPLTDAFTAETGLDPFLLEEQDERYIDFRCRYFTENFMKPLKEAITREARAAGAADTPFISVHGLADRRSNRFFALDLEDWAEKGLLDIAVGYPSLMNEPNDFCYNRQETVDAAFYADLGQKYGITTAVDLLPRGVGPDEIRRRALAAYASGVDKIALWDTYTYTQRRTFWPVIRRLGHRSLLETLDVNSHELYRYVRVTHMNGLRLDKYNPWWGL